MLESTFFQRIPIHLSAVSYHVYEGKKSGLKVLYDEKAAEDGINRGGAACFADIPSICFKNRKYNRITFDIATDLLRKDISRYSINLNKCLLKWFSEAKKAKLLPYYINIRRTIQQSQITVDLHQHTFNEIYVYLTLARIPKEHTTVFINTVKLMALGLDFGPAVLVASKVGAVNNSNHMFISSSFCSYLQKPKAEFKVSSVAALGVFSKALHSYRARKTSGITVFNCNDTFDVINTNIDNKQMIPCLEADEHIDYLNSMYTQYRQQWSKYVGGLIRAKKIKLLQKQKGKKK